jgi:hypothetical protein
LITKTISQDQRSVLLLACSIKYYV